MKSAKFFIALGRFLALIAVIALVLTWIANVSGGYVLGMSGEHLFYNVIAFPLLSMLSLLNGYLLSKGL